MGIKNGAPTILRIIRSGLFNKKAESYKINIDGELMRYKGMIELNLCKHNAEEAIAATSFDYMKNLIDTVEQFMGRRSKEIIVFMDGSRVFNKESNRSDFKFDAGLIRLTFKNICFQYGYTVNELIHGESELQMYLQRDKTMDLNVFLTNDSDMISICYGHESKIEFNDKEIEQNSMDFSEKLHQVIKYPQTIIGDESNIVQDSNKYYDLQKVKVKDSCVWINSGKSLTAVGFDYIEQRIRFNILTFRTFIALCGTDFTSSLLTESMISGILLSEYTDIMFINTLDDINEIAACLLILGIKANGTLKRFETRHRLNKFSPIEVNTSIRMYLEYINTGKMINCVVSRPCMSLACRHYLYALRNQDLCFVKSSLVKWTKLTSLSEALENLRKYLGLYDPLSMPDAKEICSSGKKRKGNSDPFLKKCENSKKTKIEYDYDDDSSGNDDDTNETTPNTSTINDDDTTKQSKPIKSNENIEIYTKYNYGSSILDSL